MTLLVLISIPLSLLAILVVVTLPMAAKRGDELNESHRPADSNQHTNQ